jgi:hypothetical protein
MSTWGNRTARVLRSAMREFGEAVEFRLDGLAPFTGRAIYRAAHSLSDVGGEVGVASTAPTLDFILSDLPRELRENTTSPDQSDRIYLVERAELFRVAGPQEPDGEGGASIRLHRLLP